MSAPEWWETLPASIDEILSPEERAVLSARLSDMAKQRQRVAVEHGSDPMASGPMPNAVWAACNVVSPDRGGDAYRAIAVHAGYVRAAPKEGGTPT